MQDTCRAVDGPEASERCIAGGLHKSLYASICSGRKAMFLLEVVRSCLASYGTMFSPLFYRDELRPVGSQVSLDWRLETDHRL